VVSGPIYYTEPVVEYLPGVWDGPTEEFRDVAYVWAKNRRRAAVAAVKKWQRGHKRHWRGCCYPHQQRDDGLSPFADLSIRVLEGETHGNQ